MIAARSLAKHYGKTVAVADLSFDVTPGVVTGFLGPNCAVVFGVAAALNARRDA